MSYWNRAKAHSSYRTYIHEAVKKLYDDCGPWPASRSKKRDAMMEELQRLSQERWRVPDPEYCVFEFYNREKQEMQSCGKLEDGRVCFEPLCKEHLEYAQDMPEESVMLRKRQPKEYTYKKLKFEWYRTFGHIGDKKKNKKS